MKKTEATSRFNAVSAVVIEMKLAPGSVSELAMEVGAALINEQQPGPSAKVRHGGPWPPEVTKAADQLRSAVEEHLLGVYFEVGDDRARAAGTGHRGPGGARKQGIVEPPVERSTDEPPQL